MKFVRPDCETCICSEVCSIKSDVSLFRTDLANMEFCNGKVYQDRISPLVVKIECRNYVNASNFIKK